MFPSTREPQQPLLPFKGHTAAQEKTLSQMKVAQYAKAYAVSVGRAAVLKGAAGGGGSVERRNTEGSGAAGSGLGAASKSSAGVANMLQYSPGGPLVGGYSGSGSKKGNYP